VIQEIISLRRQGMSFRKIAEKLDSTIGKVHYQWIKHLKVKKEIPMEISLTEQKKEKFNNSNVKTSHYLVSKLVSDNRCISFWEIAPWQRELVCSYFNHEVNLSILFLRLYDVTDIYFDGSNAHACHEFQLKEESTFWVIKGLKTGRSYLTEIGFRVNHQQFFPILRSNTIQGNENMNVIEPLPEQFDQIRPNWKDRVSTYSYYENMNEVKTKNG
jgi:uncharacterized protein